MVRYDPKILQKYAEILYRDARFVVFVTTVIGTLFGAAAGLVIGKGLASSYGAPENQPAITGIITMSIALVGGLIGYLVDQAIAFWYRLRAQLTLCQRQIELNTRVVARARQASQFDQEIQP